MYDVYTVIRRAVELPASDAWLGANERARRDAMHFGRRRADFLLGRFAAHELLRAMLGPGDDDVRAAADGAPEPWRGGAPVDLRISISHRSGAALCAGTRASLRLGADLEAVEPRTAGFVADFFAPAEVDRIAGAVGDARDELVALTWSAKESALKALHQGLRLDTRSVELRRCAPRPVLDGGWARLELTAGRDWFVGWWRRSGLLVATVVADAPFVLRGLPTSR